MFLLIGLLVVAVFGLGYWLFMSPYSQIFGPYPWRAKLALQSGAVACAQIGGTIPREQPLDLVTIALLDNQVDLGR